MKTISALVIVALVLAAAGCSHGPYKARTYEPGSTTLEKTERVILADPIRKQILVVGHNAQRLDDGRMKVFVELENRTGDNQVVQAQTQFRDNVGNLSEDETNWQTIVMPPHSSTSYNATSLNDKAWDYVVRVKKEERH